jgi:hypothetical protein
MSMRKRIAGALAALLMLAPAAAQAAKGGVFVKKEVQALRVASTRDPEDQNGGHRRSSFEHGRLRLDYDAALEGTATLLVRLEDEEGSSMPGPDKYMILSAASPDDLLDPAQAGGKFEGEEIAFAIQIDPHIKGLNFSFEAEGGFYESPRIPVLWQSAGRDAPVAVSSIWPGEKIALGVGQEVEVKVSLSGRYSDARLSLSPLGYGLNVAAIGMTLTGLAEGSQAVDLLNSDGVAIATLDVQVMPFAVELGEPPESPGAPASTLYRVLAPTIDVYSAPDTELRRMGTLRLFQTVGVVSIFGDWAELSNGTWVLAKYLLKA